MSTQPSWHAEFVRSLERYRDACKSGDAKAIADAKAKVAEFLNVDDAGVSKKRASALNSLEAWSQRALAAEKLAMQTGNPGRIADATAELFQVKAAVKKVLAERSSSKAMVAVLAAPLAKPF